MKTETILNAMEEAQKRYWLFPTSNKAKARIRQGLAFPARILRMDAENVEQLAQAEIQERNLNKRIAELVQKYIDAELWMNNWKQEALDKKVRIAELEGELKDLAELVNKHRKDRMIVDKKAAWACAEEILRRMK